MAQAQSEGLIIRFVEKAHIGRRKKEQQDYHGHLNLPSGTVQGLPEVNLFAVADGVSMGMAGALASQTAIEVLLGRFEQLLQQGTTDLAVALQEAFNAAADEVARLAQDRPGMATTCATALLVGNRLVTAHVGDSRVYLVQGSGVGGQGPGKELLNPQSPTPNPSLKLLGVDHSWVEEEGRPLVRMGELAEEDLLTDKRRHRITRALGMDGEVYVDFNTAEVEPGDLVLICSDGLWDLIEPMLLEDFLVGASHDLSRLEGSEAQARLNGLADRLEEAALAAGGRDNITLSLIRIENTGKPYPMPALPTLLARTSHDVEERTSVVPQPEENPVIGDDPTPVSFRPYQPIVPPTQSQAEPSVNYDTVFAKAQKLFALGHWDEALDEFLQIETHQPTYRNLYETLSSALLRYIEGAMQQDRPERVQNIIRKLEQAGVTRYHEPLFEMCLEEGRKASQERDYRRCKVLADFAAQFRPNDGRIRSIQELAELYLRLEQTEELSLGDRLALAQKIYARDPNFGAIQDDLAITYMELGDEAAHNGEETDALSWYQMIKPLRPSDSRLVSLAINKLRSIEDTIARRGGSQDNRSEMATRPLPNYASSRPGETPTEKLSLPAAEHNNESRHDAEAVNRLRERVSRAQKAWDAGRKEVGAEYIYLVEQLSEIISPNPWQPTFPRVCYDYGKWLLDQKQYGEARPYFQKAQILGMAAAQQRLNEIDRTLREQSYGPRSIPPADLPDDIPAAREWKPIFKNRDAQVEDNSFGTPALLPPNSGGSRQPLIQRRTEIPPEDTRFVGTSHAGDGVLGSGRAEEEAERPSPLSAAALAAGNNSAEIEEAANASREQFEKPERLVGASGTLRRRDPNSPAIDPLQSAATRELSRLQTQGVPQANAAPEIIKRRRFEGNLSLISGLTPTFMLVIVGVVIILAVILGVGLLGNLGKGPKTGENANAVATVTATTSAATTALPTTAPATTQPPSSGNITTRLEGVAPADVRVFLAAPGDAPAAFRELSLDNGAFRLPDSETNKLDPNQKYTLVVRPKDATNRKYAALPLDAPLQMLWAKNEVSFGPGSSEVALKIAPEALYFYPLDGGEQDVDLPGGGRYYKTTHHNVAGDFFRFYADNGGIARYGFPISEEFEWKDVGMVQFFERGWLVRSPDSKAVRIGRIGQTLLDEPNLDSSLKPPPSVGSASYKVDAAFASASSDNRYGKPLSAAFEISSGNAKKRVQYFELARLETDPTTKNAGVSLGLLGTEYARARNWTR